MQHIGDERSVTRDVVAQNHVDDSRLSSKDSAPSVIASTVILADSSKPIRRLRHTGKNHSLRATSASQSGSNRSSLTSSEGKHPLVHKHAQIPDRYARASVTSDSSMSMGSDPLPRPLFHASPVSNRRYSFESAEGEDAVIGQKSLVQKSAIYRASDMGGRRSILSPVQGNPRHVSEPLSSSVSGPANPRQASVSFSIPKSDSTISIDETRDRDQYTQTLHRANLSVDSGSPLFTFGTPRKSTDEDRLSLPHRSIPATPFSASSIVTTSTPGPYEVHEATAINIFPHTNRSLLVVQQTLRQDHDTPPMPAITATYSDSVRVAINGPRATPIVQRSRQLAETLPHVEPPMLPTPAFHIIPPTPAASMNATNNDPRPAVERRDSSPNASRFSMVRRALSARRYSEIAMPPAFQKTSVGRAQSVRTRPVVDKETLSQFRKPKRFWGELEDDDREAAAQTAGLPPQEDYFAVRNTLGLPQTKRAVPGPTALVKRLGSLRGRRGSVVDQYQTANPKQSRFQSQFAGNVQGQHLHHYQHQYPSPALSASGFSTTSEQIDHPYKYNGRKEKGRSRLAGPLMIPGLTSLQDLTNIMREKRENRDEMKREKRRALLRSKIGAVIYEPDDVLAGYGV